jgi:hypothetical protein
MMKRETAASLAQYSGLCTAEGCSGGRFILLLAGKLGLSSWCMRITAVLWCGVLRGVVENILRWLEEVRLCLAPGFCCKVYARLRGCSTCAVEHGWYEAGAAVRGAFQDELYVFPSAGEFLRSVHGGSRWRAAIHLAGSKGCVGRVACLYFSRAKNVTPAPLRYGSLG